MITREQAALLAGLIRTIRPAWDELATINTLGEAKDRGDLATIAFAAIRTAQDDTCKTPKAIGFDSDHWRKPEPSPFSPTSRRSCNKAGHESYFAHNCGACRADSIAVHPNEPNGSAA